MGIINTLLTGGCILGKICQAISEGVTSSIETENGKSTLRAGKEEINGVRFIEVKENEDDEETKLCAFNTDPDNYVCVAYPNGYEGANGEQFFLKPGDTQALNIKDWSIVSTDIPFYVQKIDLSEDAVHDNNRIVIAFDKFTLDGEVLILTNTQISYQFGKLRISFPTACLGDLMEADLSTSSGVSATLISPVEHTQVGDFITEYELDMSCLGVKDTDYIRGVLYFEICSSDVLKFKDSIDNKNSSQYAEISKYMCKLCGIEK
jgi:hypothetical protein